MEKRIAEALVRYAWCAGRQADDPESMMSIAKYVVEADDDGDEAARRMVEVLLEALDVLSPVAAGEVGLAIADVPGLGEVAWKRQEPRWALAVEVPQSWRPVVDDLLERLWRARGEDGGGDDEKNGGVPCEIATTPAS